MEIKPPPITTIAPEHQPIQEPVVELTEKEKLRLKWLDLDAKPIRFKKLCTEGCLDLLQNIIYNLFSESNFHIQRSIRTTQIKIIKSRIVFIKKSPLITDFCDIYSISVDKFREKAIAVNRQYLKNI